MSRATSCPPGRERLSWLRQNVEGLAKVAGVLSFEGRWSFLAQDGVGRVTFDIAELEAGPGDEPESFAEAAIGRLLNRIGVAGTCRGCEARIWWVVQLNGKRTPWTREALNHFADCPDKERFKARGARAAARGGVR